MVPKWKLIRFQVRRQSIPADCGRSRMLTHRTRLALLQSAEI
jgi:hypothetical protein